MILHRRSEVHTLSAFCTDRDKITARLQAVCCAGGMHVMSRALSQPPAASRPWLLTLPTQPELPLGVHRALRPTQTRTGKRGKVNSSLQLLRLPHRADPSQRPFVSPCPGRGMSSPVRAGEALGPQTESPDGVHASLGHSVGVVVVDHGSRRAESNANLDEFVGVFQRETGYRIVEPAHMELARPTIAEAFAKCVERGADFIIVSPYFLAPGRHWSQDIPSICAEAAAAHPGLRYMVAAPIGAHPLVAQILQDRISHCLKRVSGSREPCAACGASDALGCRVLDSPSAAQAVNHLDSV